MDESTKLDALDRRILKALQGNGRMTYDELADQVGLSPSAALRRVKRLEESGVIGAYVALVRAERIGLGPILFRYATPVQADALGGAACHDVGC